MTTARFGDGGTRGRRMTFEEPVAKALRAYTPEHRRQRRLGIYEAGLGIGGAAATTQGVREARRDTQRLHNLTLGEKIRGKEVRVGESEAGRNAIRIKARPGALIGGGLAALAGVGAVRHHAESNRGRPWD